jgi:hypothetical protein
VSFDVVPSIITFIKKKLQKDSLQVLKNNAYPTLMQSSDGCIASD